MQKSVDTGWDQALRGYEQYEGRLQKPRVVVVESRRCDSVRNNKTSHSLSEGPLVMSSTRDRSGPYFRLEFSQLLPSTPLLAHFNWLAFTPSML